LLAIADEDITKPTCPPVGSLARLLSVMGNSKAEQPTPERQLFWHGDLRLTDARYQNTRYAGQGAAPIL